MTTEAEFLEKLEAAHEFPGPYTFKLFGPNSPEFEGAAAEVIARHLPGVTPEFSARVSGKANHQCLTVVLEVASARMVMALYADFHEIQGLKMLM
ncbi:MAG: DUF493 domain-containing protein [Myxococcales bacterium]|nr:DUF493 domain-containing protein [Myxococcales bacterium]MCB9648745.1 DUF493 domain-containing protein [Deltaproteobacteria bacterium]